MATTYDQASAYSILLAQSGRTADGDVGPIEDVGADGLARLISQYQCSPRVVSVLLAVLAPTQALDDTAIQLLEEVWSMDSAIGSQLDIIGAIVDEPRDSRADDVYRSSLRVRILVNSSNGTANELLAITALYSPEGGVVRINGYHKGIIIIPTTAPDDPAGLVRRLRLAKEAGASLDLVFPAVSLASSFAFSSDYTTPGTSSTQGLGDTYGPATGGGLAYVL